MSNLDKQIDQILMRCIIGDNPITYSESGRQRADTAKVAIQQLLVTERIDELETIQAKFCEYDADTWYSEHIADRIAVLKNQLTDGGSV